MQSSPHNILYTLASVKSLLTNLCKSWLDEGLIIFTDSPRTPKNYISVYFWKQTSQISLEDTPSNTAALLSTNLAVKVFCVNLLPSPSLLLNQTFQEDGLFCGVQVKCREGFKMQLYIFKTIMCMACLTSRELRFLPVKDGFSSMQVSLVFV